MDIRIHEPEADAAERAAVDAVLGAPVSAWVGGERDIEAEGHSSILGGHAARAGRDLLLPALHSVQERSGSAGFHPARSTTSAGGSQFLRPRSSEWQRSIISFPSHLALRP